MRKVYFGRTGLEISEIALGGGVTGGILVNPDEATRYNALRRAVAGGINWIDTAPIYGNGASEETIGRHLEALLPQAVHLHQGRARSRGHEGHCRRASSAAWRRASAAVAVQKVELLQLHIISAAASAVARS